MPLAVLDDQPDLLAPRAGLLRRRAAGDDRVVSPHASVVPVDGGWVLQIAEPATHVPRAFAVGADWLAVLRTLTRGARPPDTLDPFLRRVLVDAGVLIAPSGADGSALPAARASFAQRGYGIVPDAMHPYDVASVRRDLRRRIRTGDLPLGDPQVPTRYYKHNDSVLREHQARFTALVAAVVGAPVRPSYAYLAAYTEHSILHRHTDRPQCEYSLTIPVDYTPEPSLEAAWPIRLALDDAELVVYQSLGDALVYAGRRLVHFREPLPAGHVSTSLLLHYVDADFAGPLN